MLNWQSKFKTIISGKKVCLVGFGREGKSTLKVIQALDPEKKIVVADAKSDPDYLQKIKNYDLIIRSPGVPVKLVKKHTATKAIITSQTKLFFDLCPAEIIGVTGTKGKSSTASLISQVLKTKYDTYLIGNIGNPPLDDLYDINARSKVVFELSCHQLSDLSISPHIAILLNLFPEHLDYYSSLKEYYRAKQNITKFQTDKDLFIYNQDEKNISSIAKLTKAAKKSFSLSDHSADCFIDSNDIIIKSSNQKNPIFPINQSPLIGKFNLYNLMPAIILGKHYGISKEKIIKTINNFKPLSSRLEKIGTFAGIRFVNDSLATVPEAVVQAIQSLDGEIGSIIVGGYDRGISQTKIVKAIINSSIHTVILLPTTGLKINKLIEKEMNRDIKLLLVGSMEEAVKYAFNNTQVGEICLLSPGAASFNLFKDYQDRANQFKDYVNHHL